MVVNEKVINESPCLSCEKAIRKSFPDSKVLENRILMNHLKKNFVKNLVSLKDGGNCTSPNP